MLASKCRHKFARHSTLAAGVPSGSPASKPQVLSVGVVHFLQAEEADGVAASSPCNSETTSASLTFTCTATARPDGVLGFKRRSRGTPSVSVIAQPQKLAHALPKSFVAATA